MKEVNDGHIEKVSEFLSAQVWSRQSLVTGSAPNPTYRVVTYHVKLGDEKYRTITHDPFTG